MLVPGQYLNPSVHSQKHFKMYGGGSIQSGFHLQDMKQLKVLKFYGMRVQILEIQSIEAKSGFQ